MRAISFAASLFLAGSAFAGSTVVYTPSQKDGSVATYMNATVVRVNSKARTLTFRSESREVVLTVEGSALAGLGRLHAGDRVLLGYRTDTRGGRPVQIVNAILSGDEMAQRGTATGSALETSGRFSTVTGRVVRVNAASRQLTVVDSAGRVETLGVQPTALGSLGGVLTGDQVDLSLVPNTGAAFVGGVSGVGLVGGINVAQNPSFVSGQVVAVDPTTGSLTLRTAFGNQVFSGSSLNGVDLTGLAVGNSVTLGLDASGRGLTGISPMGNPQANGFRGTSFANTPTSGTVTSRDTGFSTGNFGTFAAPRTGTSALPTGARDVRTTSGTGSTNPTNTFGSPMGTSGTMTNDTLANRAATGTTASRNGRVMTNSDLRSSGTLTGGTSGSRGEGTRGTVTNFSATTAAANGVVTNNGTVVNNTNPNGQGPIGTGFNGGGVTGAGTGAGINNAGVTGTGRNVSGVNSAGINGTGTSVTGVNGVNSTVNGVNGVNGANNATVNGVNGVGVNGTVNGVNGVNGATGAVAGVNNVGAVNGINGVNGANTLNGGLNTGTTGINSAGGVNGPGVNGTGTGIGNGTFIPGSPVGNVIPNLPSNTPTLNIVPPTASAPAMPETMPIGVARELAARDYDNTVRALAAKANEIDTYWNRYRDDCLNSGSSTSPTDHAFYAPGRDREWFVVLDGQAGTPTEDACRQLLSDMTRMVSEWKDGMIRAEVAARSYDVLPGAMREARQRYRVEF